MMNKTAACHMRETQSDITVGCCRVFIQKAIPRHCLTKHTLNKNYVSLVDIFSDVRAIECIVLDENHFSVGVVGVGEMSLLPPSVRHSVYRPATSVFQCAVETLCGADRFFFWVSAKNYPHEYKKYQHNAHSVYAEHMPVNSITDVVSCDCLAQFCTAFCSWLLYVNCHNV